MSKGNRDYYVPCGHCRGRGHVELTGVLAETLKLVRRQSETLSGADLARLDGCSNESMCMRLTKLERYGMVKSKRYGRERLWTA